MRQTLESFDWGELAPQLIHPVKVAIVEALEWIEGPMSPSELRLMLDERLSLSCVAYHVRKLLELGVLEEVERLPVRGVTKTTYFFPPSSGISSALPSRS